MALSSFSEHPIQQLELMETNGWIHVPLTDDNHKKPTHMFMIQITVLPNHQNRRDTHMRQIKIYTPVEESSTEKFPRCTSTDFLCIVQYGDLKNGTEVK